MLFERSGKSQIIISTIGNTHPYTQTHPFYQVMVAKKRVLPTEMVFILNRFKTVTFNLLCTDNTSRVCFHFYSLWYYQNPIRNKGRKNWIAIEMKREKNWQLESSLWLHPLPLMTTNLFSRVTYFLNGP